MIDIKSELLALKKKRKQDFISVIELLDFLKEHNSTTDYSEIATYLLIKLEPHDIRKTDDDLWGNEAFNVWESEHGIKTYLMPDSISDKPQAVDTSYFLTALEVVREDKNLLLFDDNAKAIDYLDEHQKNIFVDRKQIESILNINTLDEKALNNKYQNKITVAVGMALTKTDEFIKNTDINKSPVGLAERLVMQQQIAELQNRIAELEKENFKLTETRAVENNIGSTSRISTPQRAVFSLLVMKCYSDCSTRNELFSVINAELKEKGIINKDIQYTTLDKLIDEGLRINNLSPFPSKIK
ncbi:hypothetical protein [Pasteurella multocida]|uniref:hypothetical protein n=1 Tax=Pasteurella multocida TaxID=747 RepID=UPI00201FE1D5|nr:hypothetical protein [Pasteurella multocida]MCL7825594.1 hypothetical protein [Pasteurella multocida]URI04147.1 hypothetical protein M8856_07565 [Pasteurella multocida]HDR1186752.1 hypothetical protein [Pasteurella multocida]HDR1315151.1 hypothetical protein [Pasteurella multocida]HDR1927046.1 hypothetical protein [Pasteurella multocida]